MVRSAFASVVSSAFKSQSQIRMTSLKKLLKAKKRSKSVDRLAVTDGQVMTMSFAFDLMVSNQVLKPTAPQ